jgi:EAL domain-containing protein (putative c-di-GMP-specific phosphodiesterase class I)
MSVYLSPRELAEPRLAQTVSTVLEETRVEGDRLWIELSESALLRAGASATNELAAIQDLGVHIGVDAFGTGHTPLPRLQQLHADFVKIDGEFVANLTRDGAVHPPGCDVVAALVQVGTTLGLSVIAEGIESEMERALLVECGCEYGQGELLAQPLAAPVAASPPDASPPRSIDLRRL